MEYKLFKSVIDSIINTVQTTAIASVRVLKKNHFKTRISNFPKLQEVSGDVSVNNLSILEKIGKNLSKQIGSFKNVYLTKSGEVRKVTVENLDKSLEVTNLGGLEKQTKQTNKLLTGLPKAIEAVKKPIEKLREIKITNQPVKEIKEISSKLIGLKKAIDNLELNPEINVQAPIQDKIIVPPAKVTVQKEKFDYKKLAKIIASQIPQMDYQKLSEALATEVASIVITSGGGGSKYSFQDTSGNRGYGLMNILRQLSVVNEERWGLNNSAKSGNITYTGEEDVDANWIVRKIKKNGKNISMAYATVKNNSEVTDYVTAWAGRSELEYGSFAEAFTLEVEE